MICIVCVCVWGENWSEEWALLFEVCRQDQVDFYFFIWVCHLRNVEHIDFWCDNIISD